LINLNGKKMSILCYTVEPAIDVTCIKYGTELIEGVYYTSLDSPLVIPAPAAGQTSEQALADYLVARMTLPASDKAKIYLHKVAKGTMPFPSVQYKTDPHTGTKIPSANDTELKFEGTDYRNNDELYDFYSRIGDGRRYLAWGLQGSHLIGGTRGLLGSFTITAGIVDGAEMSNQIKWEYNWKGKPVPDRLTLA
jgi:hypothetical protein